MDPAATCPAGYFPIPGDSSNCATSTSSTVVTKTCPTGYTLQTNGLCGTGNTYTTTGPMYCSPRYTGKNCRQMAQVTPGVTPATGTESGPNMICAFQEGDAQYPCDPGCCTAPSEIESGSGDGTDTTEPEFPIWAIILLVVLGTIILAVLVALVAKKMSRNSRYGG
jgi:hypothetical protein